MKFHHLAVTINKKDDIQFYEQLGFKTKSDNGKITWMEGNGLLLEVFTEPEKQPGLRHFALTTDQDMEQIQEQLQKQFPNERTSKIKDKYEKKLFFVYAPDTTEIEIREE